MMMNTLESFLARARVSDWMACAHVRRCPNWQCWWDEDSVVAASGLTEDDERNLQADKMRSKARARKLAKSRSSSQSVFFVFPSYFLPLTAAGFWTSWLCPGPKCHCQSENTIKKREWGLFCPQITFVRNIWLLSLVSLHAALLVSLIPASTKLHAWWETPPVLYSWSHFF